MFSVDFIKVKIIFKKFHELQFNISNIFKRSLAITWLQAIRSAFAASAFLANPGWGRDSNFRLIRLSRPKLSLIRLSRRKLTLIRLSRPKLPLIRLSRHKRSLIRLFRPKTFWWDHLQTVVQTQIQTIATTLIRIWSDSSALEEVMIRPSCARSIYDQTEARSIPDLIRLKCNRISLIRERFFLWTNLLILL